MANSTLPGLGLQSELPTPDLPTPRVFVYALGGLGLGFAGFPLAVTIPQFYGGEVGLDPAAVGLVVLIARMIDIAVDPLVGSASDWVRRKYGSRKPFLLAGVPLLALSAWMLFVPGQSAGLWHLGLWLTLVYVGWTFLEMPYDAWGAELSDHYQVRTRLMGAKAGFGQGAQIAVVGISVAATAWGGMATDRDVLRLSAMVLVVVVGACYLPALLVLPAPRALTERIVAGSRRMSLMLLAGNQPFLRIAAMWGLTSVGVAIFTTLVLPWLRNALQLSEAQAYSCLLVQSAVTLISVPCWISIANRTSKHKSVVAALSVAVIINLGACLLVVVAPQQAVYTAVVYCTLTGLVAGGFLAIPPSMIPDVADLDDLMVGKPRVGFLYACMGVVTKLALGVGVVAATSLAAFVSFALEGGTIAQEATRTAASMIILVLPGIAFGCAALIMRGYSLTREELLTVQKDVRGR